MADDASPVDSFWATFTGLKKILYRNISLLGLILFPGTYQMMLMQFLIEEHARVDCNRSGNCVVGDRVETIASNATPASFAEINIGKVPYGVGFALYLSLFLGSVVIGLVADTYGRLNAIFPFLAIVFIGSLTSAFFLEVITIFIVLRSIAGFASGGAMHVVFVLAAEYVDPAQRPLIWFTLWTIASVAIISLSGIAFITESRKILIIAMTLPLILAVLLWKVIPESPRWVLLNATRAEDNEAQGLLERVGKQDQNGTRRRHSLWWTVWGRFHFTTPRVENDGCFTFLRRKQPRKITIVLGFTWFSLGMLYRGLNTSSIQLLSNFYANYAVRQLVNLLGCVVFLVIVTWTGRRFSTVIAMIFGSFVCIIFSVSSQGFLLAEYKTIVIVIQFVGRMFVMVAIASLGLYSMELFPTVARCSAVGLVTGIAYFGSAVTPLIMTLQQFHPLVPLGVMGCFSLAAGILCHCLLPRTKGIMTSETFDDISYPKMYFSQKSWSPKAYRRRRNDPEDESQIVNSENPFDDSIEPDYNADYQGLGKSWEVSFDRASRTSKWEMLSYDDARITPRDQPSYIDQIIHEDSNLLSDKDIEKMAKYVPSFTWVLVYSTFNHGMSLNTLYYRLREIETPVLLVVKDSNGFVFGVMSPVPPQLAMGPNFCGFGKSFFFTCKPNFKVYPCSGKNAYYMTGDSTGLAFGCSEGTFGLWLDNDLYHGRSTACDTYNSEMLSSTEDFVCYGVEAWTFT